MTFRSHAFVINIYVLLQPVIFIEINEIFADQIKCFRHRKTVKRKVRKISLYAEPVFPL